MYARWSVNALALVLAISMLVSNWHSARSSEARGTEEGDKALQNALSAAQAAKSPWPEPADDEVAKVMQELKKGLPAERFYFTRVGPWLVATDMTKKQTDAMLPSLINVYAAGIQKQIFNKTALSQPVKVYLFKDADSYMSWNVRLFGKRPGTPYGYYSRAHNAMVMNIGTGGGTMLHEMVHAMAEEDFPDIPAWLNEGLGSLYEASSKIADGRIWGVTNWRLRGLKRDLANGKAVALADLLAMDDTTFYDDEKSGSHYASARYLMQWLQAQGKLPEFYRRVRDGQDASAADSLRAVFKNRLSMKDLERRCYAWARTLSNP